MQKKVLFSLEFLLFHLSKEDQFPCEIINFVYLSVATYTTLLVVYIGLATSLPTQFCDSFVGILLEKVQKLQ